MATNYVEVDTTALQKMGNNLKTSATAIGGQKAQVESLKFGPAQAGRAYAEKGTKVSEGWGHVATWLKNWQTAIDKSGGVYTTSATSYAAVDNSNVKKITAAGVNL
ncbi:hypothetical protein [Nocardia sp. NPDC050710]|uniref:hypothetical protein n=1 Tax=Nocardia sp. NPDC050710 TaxID=3157220 RepID=UPI0033CA9656